MVVPLKGEELVNGGNGGRVGAPQPDECATGDRVGRVSNGGPPRPHLAGPGDLTSVHKAGQGEIASPECARDLPHVRPDLRHTSRIGGISPETYAAAVRKRFEFVK
jgi:hypothetical protein